MITWDDATEQWVIAMQAAGRRGRTIHLYRCHLRKVQRKVPESPELTTTNDLREILAKGDWKPETRKSVRSVFMSFFRWLHGEGHIDADPAARLEPILVPAGVARPAPELIIRNALKTAPPRERAMILLGAYAGLRIAEISVAHARHFDGSGIYVTGKGGKTRYVPVVREDIKALFRQADGYLFPGRDDGHISAGYACKIVSRQLPEGWTAHSLRHRCATQMFAGTHDLLAVGAVLGHSKPETTQRYVRIPQDAMAAAVLAAA